MKFEDCWHLLRPGMKVSVVPPEGTDFDGVISESDCGTAICDNPLLHKFQSLWESDDVTIHTSNVWPAPTGAGVVVYPKTAKAGDRVCLLSVNGYHEEGTVAFDWWVKGEVDSDHAKALVLP